MKLASPAPSYLDPAPGSPGHYYPVHSMSIENRGYIDASENIKAPTPNENKRQDLQRNSRRTRRETIAALHDAPLEVQEMLADIDAKTAILNSGARDDENSDRVDIARLSPGLDAMAKSSGNESGAETDDQVRDEDVLASQARADAELELANHRAEQERVAANKAAAEKAAAEKAAAEKAAAEKAAAEKAAAEKAAAEEAERFAREEKDNAEAAAARQAEIQRQQEADKIAKAAEEVERKAEEERRQKEQEAAVARATKAESAWDRASPKSGNKSTSPTTTKNSRLAKLHEENQGPPPFQVVKFKKPPLRP